MEKRHTQVHDRFQVLCPFCGFLAAFRTRAEAEIYAKNVAGSHVACTGMLRVWDSMAHKGKEKEGREGKEEENELYLYRNFTAGT